MKKYLIIIFAFINYVSDAQEISLLIERKPNLIKSIPNPISLSGDKCEDFIITTDNGKIESNETECKFVIYPERSGTTKIRIQNKFGKIIREEIYNVKDVEFFIRIPSYDKYISDVDHFSKSARLQLNSFDLECTDFSWHADFEIIVVNQNKRTSLLTSSKNGSLKEIREHLASLKPEDIVIFHNVKLTIGENKFLVADIVLEVK